jgi:hypothetical protein
VRERNLLIFNFSIYAVIVFLISGLESTLIPITTKVIPHISLWIYPIMYFAAYRKLTEGLVMCYLCSLIGTGFSGAGLGMMLCVSIAILFAARTFKERIFWTGFSYNAIIGSVFVLAFHIIHKIFSQVFEDNPILNFPVFSYSLEMLISALLFPAFANFGLWIDENTEQEVSMASGEQSK